MQARVGVVAVAGPAFGFGGGIARQEPLGLFAEGAVDGAFDLGPGGVGDGADGAEVVEVEPGRDAVGQLDRGVRGRRGNAAALRLARRYENK